MIVHVPGCVLVIPLNYTFTPTIYVLRYEALFICVFEEQHHNGDRQRPGSRTHFVTQLSVSGFTIKLNRYHLIIIIIVLFLNQFNN